VVGVVVGDAVDIQLDGSTMIRPSTCPFSMQYLRSQDTLLALHDNC